MLKKLFILILILATHAYFTLAQAFSCTKVHSYVGAGAGIQNIHGYNGLYATLFGGINTTAGQNNNIYLAGEAFANTGSLPISQKRFNRTTYGFGLSLLPGIIIANTTLAYIRVGIATFRYNKTNDYASGGQLGLGLQTNITTHWDIRGEYVYTGEGIIHDFGTSRFNFFNIALVYKI